ncbi:AAA family ATPase [Xanthomonas citri]|uniref:AAA family ATPase n=1 Tax=Xanthomonas citri TaxID=346 RepID=UPI0018DB6DB4|nr:AAA family ATPase [Xanthomonas citri]
MSMQPAANEFTTPPFTAPRWRSDRRARIVLVGGEKGGTGKTTLATNLSVMLAKQGRDVLLVDADPQASASSWCLFRDEAQLEPRVSSVQKLGKGLPFELKELANRYDDIIVDAGGRDSVELRGGMSIADLMISPLQASSLDIWTLRPLIDLVGQAESFNPDLQVKVLINRAPTNAFSRDAQAAGEVIADFENLEVFRTELHERTSYRRATGQGKVVDEWDDPKAIAEMKALFEEIFGNGR